MSGPDPLNRALSAQPDLFGERGLVEADRAPASTAPQPGASAAGLTDGEVIAALPEAALSSAENLCAAAVSRSLKGAVPALERLWRRFAGFGMGCAPGGAARRPERAGGAGLRACAGGAEAHRAF